MVKNFKLKRKTKSKRKNEKSMAIFHTICWALLFILKLAVLLNQEEG